MSQGPPGGGKVGELRRSARRGRQADDEGANLFLILIPVRPLPDFSKIGIPGRTQALGTGRVRRWPRQRRSCRCSWRLEGSPALGNINVNQLAPRDAPA